MTCDDFRKYGHQFHRAEEFPRRVRSEMFAHFILCGHCQEYVSALAAKERQLLTPEQLAQVRAEGRALAMEDGEAEASGK